mmetsp:Transcript_56384/g.127243  ORF Transcript_56384/g.127243 Transcript_56384/m.127243 type:complete len:287 (+) Transcript_56384:15-875(+)
MSSQRACVLAPPNSLDGCTSAQPWRTRNEAMPVCHLQLGLIGPTGAHLAKRNASQEVRLNALSRFPVHAPARFTLMRRSSKIVSSWTSTLLSVVFRLSAFWMISAPHSPSLQPLRLMWLKVTFTSSILARASAPVSPRGMPSNARLASDRLLVFPRIAFNRAVAPSMPMSLSPKTKHVSPLLSGITCRAPAMALAPSTPIPFCRRVRVCRAVFILSASARAFAASPPMAMSLTSRDHKPELALTTSAMTLAPSGLVLCMPARCSDCNVPEQSASHRALSPSSPISF